MGPRAPSPCVDAPIDTSSETLGILQREVVLQAAGFSVSQVGERQTRGIKNDSEWCKLPGTAA
jgi:hypothetical protein